MAINKRQVRQTNRVNVMKQMVIGDLSSADGDDTVHVC